MFVLHNLSLFFTLIAVTEMLNQTFIPPESLSAEQRLSEVALIIANAVIRLRNPNNQITHNKTGSENVLLALSPRQSVHVNTL